MALLISIVVAILFAVEMVYRENSLYSHYLLYR